jgi:hypothetical protein
MGNSALPSGCHCRHFLKLTALAAATAPWWCAGGADSILPAGKKLTGAKVAIVPPCRTYSLEEIKTSFQQSFDPLGRVGRLLR